MPFSDLPDFQQSAIGKLVMPLLGDFQAESIGGGRNSRIYHVYADKSYALKIYFQQPGDRRDRLRTEYSSFTFLWQHGIRTIPQPIAVDAKAGIALYEYIDGIPVVPSNIAVPDIDSAVDFVAQLYTLRDCPDAATLNAASEAHFTIQGIFDNIQ